MKTGTKLERCGVPESEAFAVKLIHANRSRSIFPETTTSPVSEFRCTSSSNSIGPVKESNKSVESYNGTKGKTYH